MRVDMVTSVTRQLSDGSAWVRFLRVWDLRAEIQEFFEKKGRDITKLSDADWMADFVFAVDVTTLMNDLNTKLQVKGLFAHEMYSLVTAFMRKLTFFSSQLEGNILTHMSTIS